MSNIIPFPDGGMTFLGAPKDLDELFPNADNAVDAVLIKEASGRFEAVVIYSTGDCELFCSGRNLAAVRAVVIDLFPGTLVYDPVRS